jgi:hypothetical protein
MLDTHRLSDWFCPSAFDNKFAETVDRVGVVEAIVVVALTATL